jgi:hypothetical protein
MAPPDHPYPPGERIARLETQVTQITTDIADIKSDLRLVRNALEQAKGFKGALYVAGVVFLLAIGAGLKEASAWLLAALKP